MAEDNGNQSNENGDDSGGGPPPPPPPPPNVDINKDANGGEKK